MKVSVVIPVYNRKGLIKRAVKSIYGQRGVCVDDVELIVVDDASTDGTYEVCVNLQKEYGFKLVRHTENRGVSAARNSGIKLASHEWIGFCDSDDEWMPDKLKIQFSYIEAHKDCRVLYTDEQWIRDGKKVNQPRVYKRYHKNVFLPLLVRCFVGTSTVLIHRDVFEKVGVFDESLPVVEDLDLYLRINLFFDIHYLDRKLIKKHAGSWSQLSSLPERDYYRILSFKNIVLRFDVDKEKLKALFFAAKNIFNRVKKGYEKRGKFEKLAEMGRMIDEIYRLCIKKGIIC